MADKDLVDGEEGESRPAECFTVQALPLQRESDAFGQRVGEYVATAVEALEQGLHGEALRELQEGRALLQPQGLQSPLLCLHMGQVKAYFGEWREAEEELKQGLDFLMLTDPTAELALQLSNSLIELHHQRLQNDQVIEQGEWTLQTWRDSPHTFELLRAVFFLTDTYYVLKEEGQGFALAEEWTSRVVVDDLSKYMQLLIQAEKAAREQKQDEVVRLYELGQGLFQQLRPSVYITVYAKETLHRADLEVAEAYLTHFPQAPRTLFSSFYACSQSEKLNMKLEIYLLLQRYVEQFPKTLGSAFFLMHLRDYETAYLRFGKARERYLQANKLFSTRYSHTFEYAVFISGYFDHFHSRLYEEAYHLFLTFLPDSKGILHCLKNINKKQDREGKYLHVYGIYKNRFPRSLHFVQFLHAFGNFYSKKDPKNAEEKYLEAFQLSSTHFPQSQASIRCLTSLTKLNQKSVNRVQAMNYISQACQIASESRWRYQVHAKCLNSLARLYREDKRGEEAVECFRQICQLYESVSPSSHSYHQHLLSFSHLYTDLGRVDEAEEYCLKAFRVIFPNDVRGEINSFHKLGKQYSAIRRADLAERYYERMCELALGNISEDYISGLRDFGKLYEKQSRLEEAEKCYLKACGLAVFLLSSDLSSDFTRLSKLYVKMNKAEALEENFIQSCTSCEGLPVLRACQVLAEIYRSGHRRTGKMERACAAISNCLAALDFSTLTNPEQARILETVGGFFQEVGGRAEETERFYKKACQISASQSPINKEIYVKYHESLAKLYRQLRRTEEAEEYYLKTFMCAGSDVRDRYLMNNCRFYAETRKFDIGEQYGARVKFHSNVDFDYLSQFREMYASNNRQFEGIGRKRGLISS